MSGIFDKYLNMINGSKYTHGQMNTKTNTGGQHYQLNSRERYVPYTRRQSSVSSQGSMSEGEGEGGSRTNSVDSTNGGSISVDGSKNPFQNPGVVTDPQVKKVLREPNNRVNF